MDDQSLFPTNTVTKTIVGFGLGLLVGGGLVLSAVIPSANPTTSHLAGTTVDTKYGQSTFTCPAVGSFPDGHPTQLERDMCLSSQLSNPPTSLTPPPANPTPSTTPTPTSPTTQSQAPNTTTNQTTPPQTQTNCPVAGTTVNGVLITPDMVRMCQSPGTYQPATNGQTPPTGTTGQTQPNNQTTSGQNPNPFNPFSGQNSQPYNATSTNLAPPPQVSYQAPAGFQDPNKCFEAKGAGLADAVKSGHLTAPQAIAVATCYAGSFGLSSSGSGAGSNNQPGQPGSNGSPNQSSQSSYSQLFTPPNSFFQTVTASVKPLAYGCVSQTVGENVANQIFNQNVQPDGPTRDKISSCFGGPQSSSLGSNSTGSNGQPNASVRQFSLPPSNVRDCLDKIPGFNNIQAGTQVPNSAALESGQACYKAANAVPISIPPGAIVDQNSPYHVCARLATGLADISTITPNSLTKLQKEKIRTCYQISPTNDQTQPGKQALINAQPTLPKETADCVLGIVGDTVFSQMSIGRFEPPSEQRKAIKAKCFPPKSLSAIQLLAEASVYPTQTELLAVADVDTKLVDLPSVIAPITSDVAANPDKAEFEIDGKVTAKVESIDLIRNSGTSFDTVSVKDGAWNFKIPYSTLYSSDGSNSHTLFAVATLSDGSKVRSPLSTFEAKASTASAKSTNNWWLIALYSIIGIAVVGLVIFLIVRRRQHSLPQ